MRDVVAIEIPRSALTLVERPRCVSQKTCERVLGVPPRAFLRDVLPAYREAGGVVAEVGRLRVVELDPLGAWLARSRGADHSRARGESTRVATAPSDAADDLAASLGLRLVGGRR
jgi:hypothetical protein